jgi:nitrite reductase/ring-hydroxylating ferredoxin subunit
MKTKFAVIALAGLAMLCIMAAVGYVAYGRVGGGGKSCCGASGANNGTGAVARPTWIDASVDNSTVSIPVASVEGGKMVNFRVTYEGTKMAFTAYQLGGQTYVRTALCPPCRSESFSLDGDVLDCDTCHSRFSATTGEGLKGACRAYPKAEARYTVAGDRLTMDITNLVTAYQETKNPG